MQQIIELQAFIIGRLVYCETSALDYAAIETSITLRYDVKKAAVSAPMLYTEVLFLSSNMMHYRLRLGYGQTERASDRARSLEPVQCSLQALSNIILTTIEVYFPITRSLARSPVWPCGRSVARTLVSLTRQSLSRLNACQSNQAVAQSLVSLAIQSLSRSHACQSGQAVAQSLARFERTMSTTLYHYTSIDDYRAIRRSGLIFADGGIAGVGVYLTELPPTAGCIQISAIRRCGEQRQLSFFSSMRALRLGRENARGAAFQIGAMEEVELDTCQPNSLTDGLVLPRSGAVGYDENAICHSTEVHPAEIRTSISPSSAVGLIMTSALSNYATEAVLKNELLLHEAVIKNDPEAVRKVLKEPLDINSRNNVNIFVALGFNNRRVCFAYPVSPPPALVHHTTEENNNTTMHTRDKVKTDRRVKFQDIPT
uniref:Uncharacterized protein n=1 Tax=Timema poppense TaxID=170557 RepID=A0A7R9CZP2_TIMPO|nr:unnamed protein product [Timema poppensis]